MFIRIEDFVAEWTNESELTVKVLEHLTDESLSETPAPRCRTLGEIAWHLVESIDYMQAMMPLSFKKKINIDGIRLSAAAIANEYCRISQDMLQALKLQWSNDTLVEKVDTGWGVWTNGYSLQFMIMHQAHHRGQMTILMRQAGLRVPDVYGPARED